VTLISPRDTLEPLDRDMIRILSIKEQVASRNPVETEVGSRLLAALLRDPSGDAPRPWPLQLRTLLELDPTPGAVTGVYGQEGVGSGKTLSTFLLGPALSVARGVDPEGPNAPRVLLLVPSDMHHGGNGQTFRRLAEWRKHYHIPPVGETFRVVSHGQASIPKNTDLFHRLKPELVIIDEAHAFAGNSVRRRRLVSWFADADGAAKYGIAPRLCVFSGTLWKKSFEDISVFLELVLRDKAPAPVTGSNAYAVQQKLMVWGSVLDAHGEPDWIARRALEPMCKWASMRRSGVPGGASVAAACRDLHSKNPARYLPPAQRRLTPAQLRRGFVATPAREFQREARDAFRRRLESTAGVVLTKDASCPARLVIEELTTAGAFAPEVAAFDSTWRLPNGEEIVEAKDAARHRRTLKWGFYRTWDWASVGFPGRPADPEAGFEAVPPGDHEWLDARRDWASALKNYLDNHARVGFDSPALVRDAAKAGDLGSAMLGTWLRWAAVADRYWSRDPETAAKQQQPPGLVLWIDRERTQRAMRETITEWKSQVGRGVIWYSSPTLEPFLESLGFATFGRGTDVPYNSCDFPACSIIVHGTGKNLQAWSEGLILQPPASNYRWEQLIGRHHRPGQEADEVRVRLVGELPGAAMQEAVAAMDIGGQRPRLLLADRVRL
tara:strand:- start:11064 stop:13061 length:1998 start_codon:yes stop_codon:yes gene_type:complete